MTNHMWRVTRTSNDLFDVRNENGDEIVTPCRDKVTALGVAITRVADAHMVIATAIVVDDLPVLVLRRQP